MTTNEYSFFIKTPWLFTYALALLLPLLPVSAAKTGFTSDYLTDTIYSFDLDTGVYQPIITVPLGADLVDIEIFGPRTLYALGYNDRNLYAIDLKNLTYSVVTSTPIGSSSELVYSVCIADAHTAYVVGYQESKIYTLNLDTGVSTTLVTLPLGIGLTNMALKDQSTGYVVGYQSNHLYKIDLQAGTYSVVTPVTIGSPSMPALEGLYLASDSLAYVSGNIDRNIYSVDLQTGSFALITPTPLGDSNTFLINLEAYDGMAYTVNNLGGEIYQVNLSNGSYQVLANIPGTNLTGMALWIDPMPPISPPPPPYIPLASLSGNNLHLANYLNQNAPQNVVSLFSTLQNDLAGALQATAPTRNSAFTYASQTGYLAFTRVISDHERQKRFQYQILETSEDETSSCRQEDPYTVWLTPFGGYTHVEAQQQTPSFNMSLGGTTAAWDYNGINQNLLGIGAGYLYTHIQEKEHLGHGNVQQGFLTFYGTANVKNWYLDLGLSGGFYYGKSVRKIAFPGINQTAESHPQGWQVGPSFEVGYNRFGSDLCIPPKLGIAPFLFVDWIANFEKKLQEHGAGSLNMGQKSRFCSLLQAEAGIRFHEILEWENGKVIFREKVAYSYQQAFGTGSITAFLLNSPGDFTVTTLSKPQNLGVIELSMLLLSHNGKIPYMDIWYEVEFSPGYQLYQGAIEIGKNF